MTFSVDTGDGARVPIRTEPEYTPPTHAENTAREAARARRHALKHRHVDIERVDPETFWVIWRDGANWALRGSARLSGELQTVAMFIAMLAGGEQDP